MLRRMTASNACVNCHIPVMKPCYRGMMDTHGGEMQDRLFDRSRLRFTNLDWRMRPMDEDAMGEPHYVLGRGMRLWNATPQNFPALHAMVQREAATAGLSGVQLVITDEPVSGRYYDTRIGPVVTLGIDFLNRARFEDVRSLVGHEIGHGLRRTRYGADTTREHHHREEHAADLVAACQIGSVDQVIRSLRTAFGNAESSYTHPSSAERIAHLELHREEVRNPMMNGANNVCRTIVRPMR